MKRLMLLLVVLVLVACGPDPYDQVEIKDKFIDCMYNWDTETGYSRVTMDGKVYYSTKGLKYNQTDSVVYIPYSLTVWNHEKVMQETFFNDKEMFIRIEYRTNILGQEVPTPTVLNDEQIEIMYKELCE